MDDLRRNPPLGRFKHIQKIYGEKQPWVVLDTLSVIFPTIGIDESWRMLEDKIYAIASPPGHCARRRDLLLGLYSGGELVPGLRHRRWLENLPDWTYAGMVAAAWSPTDDSALGTPFWKRPAFDTILELLNSPTFSNMTMQEPHEADAIFPWVARELSKLAKSVIADEGRSHRAYTEALGSLRARGGLIAQWAKLKRIDVMKLSLDEVLEATKSFRYSAKIRQGEVVYRFSTGWTVQNLKGRRELETEGKALSHCVGSYCHSVEQGLSIIYSLRDPDGVPYVTMEFLPLVLERLESPKDPRYWHGDFAQVFGQGNSMIGSEEFNRYVFSAGQENEPPLTMGDVPIVVDAIRQMIVEFIDTEYPLAWKGILLATGSLKGRNLRGADLTSADLHGADLHGANLTGANLTGADLHGANLISADLYGADLTGADLTDANLTGADLTDANLTGANLNSADLRDANLRSANLYSADLRDASLRDANLTGANLTRASLRGVRYDDTTVWPEGFDPP